MTQRYSGSYDKDLASLIDHTVMQPDVTTDTVKQQCELAIRYGFAGVCVNTVHIALAAIVLQGSALNVCTGVGFPLGASNYLLKAIETRDAVASGATEIDMVLNIGAVKAGDLTLVARDIHEVVIVGHTAGAIVKVIIETSLLNDEEKVTACLLSKEAGADFVKTSTGFSGGGATVEDINLMRRVVGSEMGVKASGGVRDFEGAQSLVKAGATRLGASAGVKIVQGQLASNGNGNGSKSAKKETAY